MELYNKDQYDNNILSYVYENNIYRVRSKDNIYTVNMKVTYVQNAEILGARVRDLVKSHNQVRCASTLKLSPKCGT